MAIHKIKFFAGRGSRYLAEKIVASYGTKLGESEVLKLRLKHLYLIMVEVDMLNLRVVLVL